MSAKILNNGAALTFGKCLNGVADIASRVARLHSAKTQHQAIIGNFNQALGAAVNFAHRIHAGCIAMPAIDYDGHINIDDVAVFHRLFIGDAVTDNMINRGANGVLIAAISKTGRDAAIINNKFKGGFIKSGCCHARFDHRNK